MSDPHAEYRAALGAWVRDRLIRSPDVHKIPSNALDIFVVPNFVTPQECEALIRMIDAERSPSLLLAPIDDPEFRTSESCNLDPYEPLVQRVEDRISDLLGIDRLQSETLQGQRYAVGQRFKLHHDFFHPGEPYWDEMERTGGQRTWTAMAFLNVPEGGGQTDFENAGIKIKPRAGNLVVWNNLTATGEPNFYSLHQGCPVTAGVKYIVTKWYRERAWVAAEALPYSQGG
ncbi:MAG TPA: 2OG-Fe(II) oxygenase [Allosphingosinicella sp.]|jgi:prolyl 4-hydroxylase|nr:2OG-Fe(II) oxygenase [Allosphingosinicella sp.]